MAAPGDKSADIVPTPDGIAIRESIARAASHVLTAQDHKAAETFHSTQAKRIIEKFQVDRIFGSEASELWSVDPSNEKVGTTKAAFSAAQADGADIVGKLREVVTSLRGQPPQAFTTPSDPDTAEFLKSAYEEAGHMERYYGTTRITASVLLLTIAATIGAGLLGAVHGPAQPGIIVDTNMQGLMKQGSILIPLGIFFIMFYVNLYFEYWGNIATRVCRYIEQLQILRLNEPYEFLAFKASDGLRVAAIRNVNRSQDSHWAQMIGFAGAATFLLYLLSDYLMDGFIRSSAVWVGQSIWHLNIIIVLLLLLLLIAVFWRAIRPKIVQGRWPFLIQLNTSILSSTHRLFSRPKELPTLASLPELKNEAKKFKTSAKRGFAGRTRILEANFVFVFLAAALYIGVASHTNAPRGPSTPRETTHSQGIEVENSFQPIFAHLKRLNRELETLKDRQRLQKESQDDTLNRQNDAIKSQNKAIGFQNSAIGRIKSDVEIFLQPKWRCDIKQAMPGPIGVPGLLPNNARSEFGA